MFLNKILLQNCFTEKDEKIAKRYTTYKHITDIK